MTNQLLAAPSQPAVPHLVQRYPSPHDVRLGDNDPLPSREACAALAGRGVARIMLGEALDLGDPRSLDAIRLIRDCVAVGIAVGWRVARAGAVDPMKLMHLWPPTELPGHDDVLEAWRDFAFGVLYWRSGPGFAVIRDIRPAFEPAWYELEDSASLELFARLREPQPLAACRDFGSAFTDLLDAQLVLTIGDACLALPYRIHKWPVPFLSV